VKRVIKDYKSITDAQLQLIADRYPEGFAPEDLIVFNIPGGDSFMGLEVKTEDTIYLFKINTAMLEVIDDFTEDSYDLETFSESEDYEYSSEDSDEEEDKDKDD
jgi:hypothetical protein